MFAREKKARDEHKASMGSSEAKKTIKRFKKIVQNAVESGWPEQNLADLLLVLAKVCWSLFSFLFRQFF
jgi:hypothetical protein